MTFCLVTVNIIQDAEKFSDETPETHKNDNNNNGFLYHVTGNRKIYYTYFNVSFTWL